MVLQVGMDCPEIQHTLHPQATQLAQDTTILPAERAEVGLWSQLSYEITIHFTVGYQNLGPYNICASFRHFGECQYSVHKSMLLSVSVHACMHVRLCMYVRDQEVEHTMRMFEGLFEKCKEEAVVTAAIQSWTLLLSIAPDHAIPSLFTR